MLKYLGRRIMHTKAEKEIKGRLETVEQTASSSSRELQQTTIGKDVRRPDTPKRSTSVSCKVHLYFISMKYQISNSRRSLLNTILLLLSCFLEKKKVELIQSKNGELLNHLELVSVHGKIKVTRLTATRTN